MGWKATLVVLVVGLSALSSATAFVHLRGSSEGENGWREIAWPFPRDGWPSGRAFRCSSEACGGEVELYVRPKIGFCNCTTGVADDDEVDRVADLDLLSDKFEPVARGEPVQFGEMNGRIRAYRLSPGDTHRAAFGVALSRRCDLMVAAIRAPSDGAATQQVAIDFLKSHGMAAWMVASLQGSSK